MSIIDRMTGREALLNEIAELKLEIRRLKRGGGRSSSGGMISIIGLKEMVLQLDNAGIIEYANTAFAEAVGYAKADIVRLHFAAFDKFPFGPGVIGLAAKRAKETQSAHAIERSYLDPATEHTRYVNIIGVPREGGTQVSIADVTELKSLEEMFGRYVSPQVIEKMKNSGKDFYRTERYVMTVLFCDLREFTALSEKLPPDGVKECINTYLAGMADVILNQFEATIDKFVGDEVMALFGAPVLYDDHALRAVRAALAMLDRQAALNREWLAAGVAALDIGIGINTGEMVVGNIGAEQMVNYTVLGHHVNLGARLCDKAGHKEVLISEYTHQAIQQYLAARPEEAAKVAVEMRFMVKEPMAFKNVSTPVTVYAVELIP